MNVLPDDQLRARLPAAPAAWEASPLRLAAVLVPWLRRDGVDHLLFTVRRPDLRQHAGQISFPGGMRHGDESPVDCALRECREEIGVPMAAVTVLGGLPARSSSSQIRVHAVVARIDAAAILAIDPTEVERLLAVPWPTLRRHDAWRQLPPPDGRAGPSSPQFTHGEDLIWGLTGRFCRDLVDLLQPA